MAKRRSIYQYPIYDNEAGMLALLEKVLLENGFEVYKEVETPNGFCDIVAVLKTADREIRWGIEGKMQCNEAVIKQAYNNKELLDYVSICTPAEPNWIYKEFMKHHGIGILKIPQYTWEEGVYKDGLNMLEGEIKHILPHYEIPLYDGLHIMSVPVFNLNKKKDVTLHELQKLEKAGKSSGERLTTYKMTVIKIQEYLKGKDWVNIKTILKEMEADLYWSNPRAGLYNIFQSWEVDKFEYRYENRVSEVRLKGIV